MAELQRLRELIIQQLSGLIDADYVYLELPYYENPGDVLIWEGTEQFLETIPHKCLYKASSQTYQYREIPSDVIIILQGGGNFGDLWGVPHQFRKQILLQYPDNRIIMLPQTVYYKEWKHLREDAVFFSLHKHLTLCARDEQSYRLLKLFAFSNHILLLPDMAFMIDSDKLKCYCVSSERKALFVKRVDKELSENHVDVEYDNVQDWPSYMQKDEICESLLQMIRNPTIEKSVVDQYADEVFRPHMVELAVRFLSAYNQVVTTRLHAGILSVLLGIKATIVDNSYGKNSSFYDSWLRDVKDVNSLNCNAKSFWTLSMLKCALQVCFDRLRIWAGSLRYKAYKR